MVGARCAAAALLLAACSVDVEGARCRVPGATEDCPAGQACGVDGRCSARAAQCTREEDRCRPGVDTRCSADATRVETCTDADPCGAWAQADAADDCSALALVCEDAGSAAACACAVPESEIVVDAASPGAVDPVGAVAPTGASTPAACRFKALAPALDYARGVWRPAHGGSPVVVRARGAGAPVVFSGESLPLVVAPGVTLATAGGAAGDWVIAVDVPDANGVEVHDGGTVEGFTVRGAQGATGHAIEIVCTSEAPAAVARVAIEGGGTLRRGISVGGRCGVVATEVRVAAVNGPGVHVDADLADAAVPVIGARIDGGTIEGCDGPGAEVRSGALTLHGVAVRGNGGSGVKAKNDDVERAIALELEDCTVEENGEAGLLVRSLDPGSSMKVRGSTFTRNRASTASETGFTAARRAGGVYLYGAPPAAPVFEGNRVYGNANASTEFVVDQLVTVSGVAWHLSAGPACGAGANVFACPGNGKLVYGSGAAPDVSGAYWPTDPPDLWPPQSLVVNATVDPTCDFDPSPIPACPAAPAP